MRQDNSSGWRGTLFYDQLRRIRSGGATRPWNVKTRLCFGGMLAALMLMIPIGASAWGTTMYYRDPSSGLTFSREATGMYQANRQSEEYFAVTNGNVTGKKPYIELEYSSWDNDDDDDVAKNIYINVITKSNTYNLGYMYRANDNLDEKNTSYGVVRVMGYRNDKPRIVTVRVYLTQKTLDEGLKGIQVSLGWDWDDDGGKFGGCDDLMQYTEDVTATDVTPQVPTFSRPTPNNLGFSVSGINSANYTCEKGISSATTQLNLIYRLRIGSNSYSSSLEQNVGKNTSFTNNAFNTSSVSNKDDITLYYKAMAHDKMDILYGSVNRSGWTVSGDMTAMSDEFSVKVPGCAYVSSVNATFSQWTKSMEIKWDKVTQDRNCDGRWYIYREEFDSNGKSKGDKTYLGSVDFSSSSYTDDKVPYDGYYKYYVTFILDAWKTTDFVSDLSAVTNNIVSTVRTMNMNITWDQTETNSIKMDWSYDQISQSSTKIYIDRKIGASGSWTNIYNEDASSTNKGTYTDKTPSNTCTDYYYRLRFTVMGKEFIKELTSAAHLSSGSTVKSVKMSKGTYAGMVKVTWEANQVGSDNTYYSVMRKVISSSDSTSWSRIYSTSGTSSTYYYEDNTALPGQYYKYMVVAYGNVCSGTASISNQMEDVGFSQTTGIVSGRITYGTGMAVDGVKVNLFKASDDLNNKAQFYSMEMKGSGSKAQWCDTTVFKEYFLGDKPFTIQMWVNPNFNNRVDGTATSDFSQPVIMDLPGICAVLLTRNDSKSYYLSSYLRNKTGVVAVDVKDLIIPAGKFTNVALSYNGNGKWKFRTITTDTLISKDVTTDGTKSWTLSAETKKYGISFGGAYDASPIKSFRGYIDDVRLWTSELTDDEMKSTYNRILGGSEKNLKLYWPMDEGINDYVFDISRTGGVTNENHGSLHSCSPSSAVIPTSDQLGVYGVTDSEGNYVIRGVPFSGEGTNYTLRPALGIHEFSPQYLSRFVSSNSLTHNAVDFSDVSSFPVSGTIYYSGTLYPVEGVSFYVDGTVCSKNNVPVKTDSKGEYTISVPIGSHYITVEKTGHTFVNNGRYPADPNNVGAKETFIKSLTNLNFSDTTLVTIAGRVCGGTVEESKALGFGLSKNNIGQAEITLSSGDNGPKLNVVKVVDAKNNTTYQYNNNASNVSVVSPTTNVNSTAYRKGGDENAVKQIVIKTDPTTGEFAALVPPILYKVESIKIPSNTNITLDNLQNIDATSTITTSTDSTVTKTGNEYFTYTAKMIKAYRSEPTFIVTQKDSKDGAFGISSYDFTDDSGKSTISNIYTKKTDGTLTYNYGGPLFVQDDKYTFCMEGYEKYKNLDDASNPDSTTVPLSDCVVKINNALSSSQSVYTSNGTNGEVEGQVDNLASDELSLDSLGKASYTWRAGFPNIIAPYSRTINIVYTINGKEYQWGGTNGMSGIILGNLPTGNDFVTSGPDMVEMILRDPPGTASSASWETGTSTTQNVSVTEALSQNSELNTTASFGLFDNYVVGSLPGVAKIVLAESIVDTEAGLNTDVSVETSKSWSTTTTTTKKISTSGEMEYVGTQGDVFVGKATNVVYGEARKVDFKRDGENFKLDQSNTLTTGLKFGTNFNYTQNYIENVLIPNFETLRANLLKTKTASEIKSYINNTDKAVYLTTLSPDDEKFGTSNNDKDVWGSRAVALGTLSGPSYTMVLPQTIAKKAAYQDSVQWINNQIETWKNTLADNEKAKVTAIKNRTKWLDKNYSFDSGAAIEASSTSESSTTVETNTSIQVSVYAGLSTSVDICGTGTDIELKVTNTSNTTAGKGSTTTNTVTTGYSLVETGDDDALTVDVLKAPDGFGPIFYTQAGRTCCPYEGKEMTKYYLAGSEVLNQATTQIEQPHITVDNAYATDVPSGKAANYTLKLSNTSETGEDVYFDLKLMDETNANGAKLSIDGQPLTDGRAIKVPAGTTVTKALQLTQTNTSVLNYNRIGLVLASQCQGDPTSTWAVIADTAYVSAQFVPSSTDVTLNIDKTTMNMFTGDTLAVTMKDFDRAYKNFKAIRLQYKYAGNADWTLAREYVLNAADKTANNELIPTTGNIELKLPMSNSSVYPDGVYQFRAVSVANYGTGEVTRLSDVITVTKDLARPQVIGNANPSDGILSAGDEIGVTYNETIRNGMLSKDNNFIVTGTLNGAKIAHDVALKMENTDKAAATEADIQLAGKSFAAAMWMNYTSAGTLLSHGNGTNKFTAAADAEGHLVVTIDQNKYTSQKTMPKDKWDYFCISYNYDATLGSKLSAMVAYDDQTDYLFTSEKVADYTGTGSLSVGQHISGAVQELTLWDKALTMAEAQADMYKTKSPSTPYLIGYWKFDEANGTVAADVARSRNMVLPVANWYLNNTNKAVTLKNSEYLSLSISKCSVPYDDDYAYEMWFKGAKQQGAATLFATSTGTLSLGFDATGKLQLTSNGESTTFGTADYLDNAWHHVALNVLRNGNAALYVDGTSVGKMSASSIATIEGSCIYVGAQRNGTVYSNFFTGAVDEIRLWDATMSANVLKAGRLNRLNGDEAGLVAYYPFEKKSLDAYNQVVTGTSATDASDTKSGDAVSSAAALTYTDEAPSLKEALSATNISYTYVASDKSVVISLTDEASLLEGCTVNFTMRNVHDVNDNISEPIHWSAYVRQNQLLWSDEGISVTQKNQNSSTFTATISNESGNSENWEITNLPSWLTANATQGTLKPLTSKVITFTVSPSTAIGKYEETLYLSGNNQIYEPFTVKMNVEGEKPDWSVNAASYETEMNIVGNLKFMGKASENTSDMIAAFIDGKCVGVASPAYYERYDTYYTLMTVHGNYSDVNKSVTFKAWDAATGTMYPSVAVSSAVTFKNDDVIGSMAAPLVWNADDKIEQDIDMVGGWNWISFYTKADDMAPATIFSAVDGKAKVIKAMNAFTSYDEDGWTGTLTSFDVTKMYKTSMTSDASLAVIGSKVVSKENPVSVQNGWNWIGYNASSTMSPDEAFAALSPADGDVVKSQNNFAIYNNYQWEGTLKTLTPGAGYMYKSNATATRSFNYPAKSASASSVKALRTAVADTTHFNRVSEHNYPNNMTVTARVMNGNMPATGVEIGVFCGSECRSNEVSDSTGYVYLTISGDGKGQLLNLKSYADGKENTLAQTMTYADDAVYGTHRNPYIINLSSTTGISATTAGIHVYPAQVTDFLHVDGDDISSILIEDAGGRVQKSVNSGLQNHNTVDVSTLIDGIYLVVVNTADGHSEVTRMMKRNH